MKTGYVTNHYSIVPKMVRRRKGKLERNAVFELYMTEQVYRSVNRSRVVKLAEIGKQHGGDPMIDARAKAKELSRKYRTNIDIVLQSNSRVCETVKFRNS